MANDEFRDQQQAARDAGLAARHETRVERARDREFVQAELWRVANAARRDVTNEIAAAILAVACELGDGAQRELCYDLERTAREIGNRETS